MRIDRIRAVAATMVLSLAGFVPETVIAATLSTPYGLAVTPSSGRVYIADPGARKVAAYDPVSGVVSTFVTQSNPFSVAVNSDSLVYVGVVGANSQINIFNSQGRSINSYPLPSGDSPITMTFDSDNILYQGRGHQGASTAALVINAITNDLVYPYSTAVTNPGASPVLPYYRLPTYTILAADSRYALAYDHGQIFILGSNPPSVTYNAYDAPALLSGRARDLYSAMFLSNAGPAWLNAHTVPLIGAAFAATVDSNHIIFYTDPDSKSVVVTGKATSPKKLLSNLSSAPYGIAFDRTRSRLYVSFPSEHLVRAYSVTYTIQNGVKIPALSALATIR